MSNANWLSAFAVRSSRIVFILLIALALFQASSVPSRASLLLQTSDTSYEFDAQAYEDQMGYRHLQECASDRVIQFIQSRFASRFTPGQYYHVRGAGPSVYPNALWEIYSISEISGCPSPRPAAEPQVNFYVDQHDVTLGQCTTLHWDVENVWAVYLDGQGVTGHESKSVCPSSTTTYNLRIASESGTMSRNVTVAVQVPSPTPIPPPQVVFSADRTDIALGECTTLNWAVAYVQSWSLDNAVVSNPGSRQVCPNVTTTYTLQANAPSGSLSRSVMVHVAVPQFRVADFTLLDPTQHASLTDFSIINNPSLLSTRNLWIRIANDGGSAMGVNYQIQVVLKGPGGDPVGEYDYASGSPLSLAPISLDGAGNTQNVYVPILFTQALDSGIIEVSFKPDPALGLPDATLSKTLIPSQPSATAKKIRFAVNQGTFSDLQVVGPNQYGVETTWLDPDHYTKWISETDNYWWQDTVVLTFKVADLGWRGCILDYISDATSFNTVDVIYTEGSGCSGGRGSAAVVLPEKAVDDYRSTSTPMIPFKCLKSVAKQVSQQGNVVLLAYDCVVSPGIAIANAIASHYGKTVKPEEDTGGSPTPPPAAGDSTTTVTDAPTATPAPPPPPGVYITKMRFEPPNATNAQDIRFFVTFWNTAGPLKFKWCVYVYDAGAQNPRGQTACDAWIDFPLGTYEYATPNTWKLGTGASCTDLTAVVQGIETNGSRLTFKTPDFSENQLSFRVCP